MKKISFKDNADKIMEILRKKINEINLVSPGGNFSLIGTFGVIHMADNSTDCPFVDTNKRLPVIMVVEESTGLVLTFALGSILEELSDEN